MAVVVAVAVVVVQQPVVGTSSTPIIGEGVWWGRGAREGGKATRGGVVGVCALGGMCIVPGVNLNNLDNTEPHTTT